MNPRRPYRGRRIVPDLGPRESAAARLPAWLWLGLPLAAVVLFVALLPRSLGGVLIPTALASPTARPRATTTPAATRDPAGLATPTVTPLPTPASTRLYLTQSGDTLPALAARFGVSAEQISAPAGLKGATTLAPGQLLVIPAVLTGAGPGNVLIPNSEFVFSGAAAGFDPQQFAAQQGGHLAAVNGFVDGRTAKGGEVVLRMAENHAINPRLLTALIEYESGWVTEPNPAGDALTYPLGYVHPYRTDLVPQLSWAAAELATGYYGWRAGTLTTLTFPDGATLRLDPTLNAGSVALQYFFAQILNRPAWDEAVSANGFLVVYEKFFGDPLVRAVDPLIPQDLAQPPLALPFLPGHTWSFSGGPHGAWELGGAQAALDFAPASLEGGCVPSAEWATAVAAGKIVRADNGSVLLDLDGDGREATGWVILYLHIASEGRVAVGKFVEPGDLIGHPSCEGGQATGTHLHLARKYNGEWIPADSVIPFTLSGWVAHQAGEEYAGTLTRGDQTVKACRCTAGWTAITADP